MNKKLLNVLLGFGIFLIILAFNPFFPVGLYLDSTASYNFIAGHKILILGVLDTILVSLWFINVVRTKQLKFTSTKIYIPVFLFLLSAVFSTLFSINKYNSIFGFNATMGTSLIETALLITFFLFFVNQVRSSDSVIFILRFLLLGISLTLVWTLFRYSSNVVFESVYLREYANSRLFSPLGGHGALLPISLFAMCMGAGLFILNLIYKKNIPTLIIDGLNLALATVSFFNFASIDYKNKNYFFAIMGLLFFAFVAFLFAQFKNLKPALIPVSIIFVVSLLSGVVFTKTIASKNLQGFGFPQVAAEASLSVTVDSMKESFLKRGILGLGQGNFAYAFDQYKSEASVASRPLTINNGAPMVGEVRANYSGNYALEVLFGQGVFGFLAFLSLGVFILYKSIKKLSIELNLLHLFAAISFAIVFVSLFAQSYESVLVLMFWILGGVLVVLMFEDEPQKDLDISINGKAENINNFNYILPLILMIITGFSVFNMYKISNANVSMFWGKVFQSVGNLDEYRKSSFDAVKKYSNSDVFVRELVNGNGIKLVDAYASLQKDLSDNPDKKDTQETTNQKVALDRDRLTVINDLSEIIRKFPHEYKNYYLLGSLQSTISEITQYSLDNDAKNAFDMALAHHKYHPDTNYQLALIYERNKRFNEAFVKIDAAYRLNQNDLYLIKYADISAEIQDFDRALNIYKGFKAIKDQNPNNEQIKTFYESFNIDKKIEEVEKLIAQRDAAKKDQENQAIPTGTPIPSVSPTVVPSVTTTVKPSPTR